LKRTDLQACGRRLALQGCAELATVRDNLRHASLSTTSISLRSETSQPGEPDGHGAQHPATVIRRAVTALVRRTVGLRPCTSKTFARLALASPKWIIQLRKQGAACAKVRPLPGAQSDQADDGYGSFCDMRRAGERSFDGSIGWGRRSNLLN
jgi:hypothetical protein